MKSAGALLAGALSIHVESLPVVLSFLGILLLLVILNLLHHHQFNPSSPRRNLANFLLWMDTTFLAVLFCWQATDAISSPYDSILIWSTAAAASCYFLHGVVSAKASK
jgi:uncharacterized membrane protein